MVETMLLSLLFTGIYYVHYNMLLSRVGINFSINKACQFLSHPLESRCTTIKMILKYLKGSLYHGILLKLDYIHVLTSLKTS